MAKYRKTDNCGPVPYPDQSGRYLGEGEVVEDDAANSWAPLMALGFVVETEAGVTPDRQESKEELVSAVVVPSKPPQEESEPVPRKRKTRKRVKKEEVNDGMSADDGAGAEEMDSSEAWESDS